MMGEGKAGVGKRWDMPSLWVAEPFGGGNEGLCENLHLFRIYGSPDGTNIMTLSRGEITRSLAVRVSQKSTFGWRRTATKYKVTSHSKNTLTKNSGLTLRFGSPGPQKISDLVSLGSKLRNYCTEFTICSFESS